MKNEILAKVEESFKLAEAFYNKTFERPKNIIFKRNGTTAGHSNYAKRELMFQLDLAETNKDHFLKSTVPHEVAHYVQRAVYGYGCKPHGREWKYVMTQVMGIPANRCHSYDTSFTKTRSMTRYEYKCDCRTHKLSATLHNKIKKGQQRFCLSCKRPVILVSNKSIVPQAKVQSLQDRIEALKNEIKQLESNV